MRVRLAKRYYCDFCKKSGSSKFWMIRHEESCTKNPYRICRFCKVVGNPHRDISPLIEYMKEGGSLKDLREMAEHCPGCILAIIVQSDYNKRWSEPDGALDQDQIFDFRKEKAAFWEEIRLSQYVEPMAYWPKHD